MLEKTYTFDTKHDFWWAWVLTALLIIVIWLMAPLFYEQRPITSEMYFGKIPMIGLGIVLLVFIVTWLHNRNIVYELNSDDIIKRRGNRIMRSIEVRDIRGLYTKPPIRLRIVRQKDFVFDGMILAPPRKKLLIALQEIGIKELI